jgi:hypothetical protein
MNVPRYAAAAARLLRQHLPASQPPAPDKALSVATIERAIVARAHRRRLAWGVTGLALAAAIPLAFQLTQRPTSSASAPLVSIHATPSGQGVALHAGGAAQPLSRPVELASGQRIETSVTGGASLRLSTGSSLDLAGDTVFRVDSQGAVEHFSLQYGGLSAHVAKLAVGQRFIVTTPDAEIEVRGTRFQLRVLRAGEACGARSRTRLRVTEGLVLVSAGGVGAEVRAGQIWPSDCDQGAEASTTSTAADPQPAPVAKAQRALLPRSLPNAARVSSARPSAAPETASALSLQNNLFAQGVAANRRGDAAAALRAFQDLIARYPNSPLLENALAQRMRILASSQDARAKQEARRYLSRYPRGFASKEAERIAAGP